jgi:hypothetical protein
MPAGVAVVIAACGHIGAAAATGVNDLDIVCDRTGHTRNP